MAARQADSDSGRMKRLMTSAKSVKNYLQLSMAIFALVSACSRPQEKPAVASSAAAPKQDVLVSDMDTSVNPGEDFFSYANGEWIKKNPDLAGNTH